jgi:hypothetical protein
MIIPYGKTSRLLKGSPTGAGSQTFDFSIESDTVLVTLAAKNITGTLDVYVKTFTNEDSVDIEVIRFAQLNADTAEILLKKAAVTLSNLKLHVEYSNAVEYEVYARAISGGETTVRITGASNGDTNRIEVGNTPVLLTTPSAFTRSGFIVKNNSNSGVLEVSFTAERLLEGKGFTIEPKDSLAADIVAGGVVYGRAVGAATIDAALIEGGN